MGEIYSATLRLINADKVIRRIKYVPPKSDEFSMVNVVYPTQETGSIAPGMEVTFEILFKANSLADYADELIVISEKNNFVVAAPHQIPLVAFREQPSLNLQPNIEVNSCWVGQTSASTIQVKNKGGHAGFWIMEEKDEPFLKELKPDSYEEPGVARVGPFVISPDKFFLGKGETVTLHVKFEPTDEGKFSEVFLLGCDNLKSYKYSIAAESNMIELVPTLINGFALPRQPDNLKEIHFRDVPFSNPASKSFEIENLTKNKINFEWRVDDQDRQFAIEAARGQFAEREKKSFEVTFQAGRLLASYCHISLLIKDIPLESVRNPPPHILEQIRTTAKLTAAEKQLQKVEFVYFNFTLFGEVLPVEYTVSPEVFRCPQPQPINKPKEVRFTIKNLSKCGSFFSLERAWSSHPELQARVVGVCQAVPTKLEPPSPAEEVRRRKRQAKKAQVSQITQISRSQSREKLKEVAAPPAVRMPETKGHHYVDLKQDQATGKYRIGEFEELDIFIEFSCSVPARHAKTSFLLHFEHSRTTSIDLLADFQGTKLRICAREVDFGIVKSFSTVTREFEIENFSDVDAEVLIKSERHKPLDLESSRE